MILDVIDIIIVMFSPRRSGQNYRDRDDYRNREHGYNHRRRPHSPSRRRYSRSPKERY